MKVRGSFDVYFSYVVTQIIETNQIDPEYSQLYDSAIKSGCPPPDQYIRKVVPLDENEAPCIYDIPIDVSDFGKGESSFDFIMNYVTDAEGQFLEKESVYVKLKNLINNYDTRYGQLLSKEHEHLHQDNWFIDLVDSGFVDHIKDWVTEFQIYDFLDYHYQNYCWNQQSGGIDPTLRTEFIKHLDLVAKRLNYVLQRGINGWIARTENTPIHVNTNGKAFPRILKNNEELDNVIIPKLIQKGILTGDYRWNGLGTKGRKKHLAGMLRALEKENKLDGKLQYIARQLCEYFDDSGLIYKPGMGAQKNYDRTFGECDNAFIDEFLILIGKHPEGY